MYTTRYFMTHLLPSGKNILVNTLSGSLDYVSESGLSRLRNPDGDHWEMDAEEKMLRQKGYLFDSLEEEQALVDSVYQREQKRLEEKPYVFVFCLTYACNLRCFYCFEENYHHLTTVMRKEDIDKIIRFMERIMGGKKDPVFRVVLEGGEPFLDHQEDILKYLFDKMTGFRRRYKGFQGLSIFTNGENTAAYLGMLKSYRSVIEKVLITLAGPEKLHNSYRISYSAEGNYKNVIRTTSLLLKNGIPVLTVLNIDRNNIQCLPEISCRLKELQWKQKACYLGCYVSRIKYFDGRYSGQAVSEYDILQAMVKFAAQNAIDETLFNLGDLKLLKSIDGLIRLGAARFYNCAAADGKQYLFGPDGQVYNCTKVTAQETYSVGNYREDPVLDQDKVQWWREGAAKYNRRCGQCRYAFICGGKCRYEEEKLGAGKDQCKAGVENLLSLYLDNMETRKGFIQQDVIYDK